MSDAVRVGVIGYGNMGSSHANQMFKGAIDGAKLAAVCDIDPKARERASKAFGEPVAIFDDAAAMLAADCVDAVLIATPHYDHPPLAIAAFNAGCHVLSEKPAGVYTKQIREMNAVADASDRIFGLMFQQRLRPAHIKVRDLIQSGELGDLKRNNWIITNWYRAQSYYDSGGWRATWGGEGGGVLVNQCPHQLDMWQWFCGMPKRVRAFCAFGKYHNIEVEDDVTAFVEYENGATGTFITSTGEAPGSNRLEIAGDRGNLILEGSDLIFKRNRVGERQFNAEYEGGFGAPECWECKIPARGSDQGHSGVMKRWIQAIQANDASKLVADGQEGIHGVELANAMLLSAWTNDWVDLPIDEDLFYEKLQERIASSTFVKKTGENKVHSVEGTF